MGDMFTEEQKDIIKELREDNKSYKIIADMLESSKNTIKGYCNNNGLGGFRGEGYNLKEKEQEFKERFERMFPDFFYHSGYTGCQKMFKCQCRTCGHIEERNAICAKASKDRENIRCDNCHKIASDKKEEVKTYERLYRDKSIRYHPEAVCPECGKTFITRGPHQKYCNDDCYKESNSHGEYIKQCKECGTEFTTMHNGNTYCSDKCRRRKLRRYKVISKDARLRLNGKVDYSITLSKLSKRDKTVCHICGKICDESDFHLDDDGYFIAGRNYPSIDHVFPISKGGIHSWSNVKLAHRQCNSIKRDNILYDGENIQITTAI